MQRATALSHCPCPEQLPGHSSTTYVASNPPSAQLKSEYICTNTTGEMDRTTEGRFTPLKVPSNGEVSDGPSKIRTASHAHSISNRLNVILMDRGPPLGLGFGDIRNEQACCTRWHSLPVPCSVAVHWPDGPLPNVAASAVISTRLVSPRHPTMHGAPSFGSPYSPSRHRSQ